MAELFEKAIETGAEFSPDRVYRYALWRYWGDGPRVAFVGLNPSTADETEDDPTIRRCIRFAKDWGYTGLVMLNAYGFRATLPKDMLAAADPVGPGNDEALTRYVAAAGLVIAAWGAHCRMERAAEVIRAVGRPIDCLGWTRYGFPKHPLYLRADSDRLPFWRP